MTWDGRKRTAPRVEAGIIAATDLPIAAAGTIYSYDVTFDAPFASAPSVTVSAASFRPDFTYVGSSSVSATGFTLYYGRTAASGSTVAFSVSWQAIAVAA